MGIRRSLWVIVGLYLASCAGAGARGGGTTPVDQAGEGGGAVRFAALEQEAEVLDAAAVAALPEVAGEDQYFLVEALLSELPFDASRGGIQLIPPEEWTIGVTSEGEEIRLVFLEPEGGAMVVAAEGEEADGMTEAQVSWLVRFARRNVLLTEVGSSVAVHLVPVAARFEVEGRPARFWISSEAPRPDDF